tara:strand:- start:378 stop:797 length:420 start_codon:yes stop_codon:yes gene_type:complete
MKIHTIETGHGGVHVALEHNVERARAVLEADGETVQTITEHCLPSTRVGVLDALKLGMQIAMVSMVPSRMFDADRRDPRSFGYTTDESGDVVEQPYRREALARIAQMRADGVSLRDIADEITRRYEPTSFMRIRRMLQT